MVGTARGFPAQFQGGQRQELQNIIRYIDLLVGIKDREVWAAMGQAKFSIKNAWNVLVLVLYSKAQLH